MAHDPRELVRLTQGRQQEPGAAVMDGRTVQSTPESRHRAGFDTRYAGHFRHERKQGLKVHAAVDTPGLRLTLIVIPANEQGRAQVEELASQVQAVTGESVEVTFVDQGHTGEDAAEATRKHGIKLVVIKHEQAKRGFILLPRRWVLERAFA